MKDEEYLDENSMDLDNLEDFGINSNNKKNNKNNINNQNNSN